MSQAPSTLGTITTSSCSPISATSVVRSSSTQGLSSELTRVQSAVWPKSDSVAALIRPCRAASLRSTGIASSRLPSRMSVCLAMSAALATIFSFEKSRKWIIREGLTGISAGGSGAPIASGWKKSLGFLKLLLASFGCSRPNPTQTRVRGGERISPAGGVRMAMVDRADTTQDWLLSEGSRPPTVAELLARIDEALAMARSSEAAVSGVGEAAFDAADRARDAVAQALIAAEQAHRSAQLVERLSATMIEERRRPGAAVAPGGDRGLRSFSERADRVADRLRAIERVPLSPAT